eukprot:COSAG01_NODE_12986_length_1651_cov_450.233097_1_plen_374_part_10
MRRQIYDLKGFSGDRRLVKTGPRLPPQVNCVPSSDAATAISPTFPSFIIMKRRTDGKTRRRHLGGSPPPNSVGTLRPSTAYLDRRARHERGQRDAGVPHAGGKPWSGPSGIRLAIPIGVPWGGGWLLNDRQSQKVPRSSTPADLTYSCGWSAASTLTNTPPAPAPPSYIHMSSEAPTAAVEEPALAPVEEPAPTSAPAEQAEAPAEEEEPAAEPEEEPTAEPEEEPAAEEGVPPPTQSPGPLAIAHGEAIPALTGVLARCADRDGPRWQDGTVTLDAKGVVVCSHEGGEAVVTVPHRRITGVRLVHTADEACGRLVDCVLRVDTVADEGGETSYLLAATSETERSEWVRRFCAFRQAELAAASALGPSVACLKT